MHPLVRRLQRILVGLLVPLALSGASAAADPQVTTLEYKRVGDEVLLLDIGAPDPAASAGSSGLRPVVIVVHGGGWAGGDRKTDIPSILQTLNAGGYLYVAMDYRLRPKHPWPACRDDVADAVAWTKAHIRDHGGDPDRIAILGYSAGGHLAFWAAIRDQPPHALKGLIGLAPATDLLEDLGRRGGPDPGMRRFMDGKDGDSLGTILARLYEASPINALHDGMPPILLLHGTEDRSVPFQQSFHIKRKIADNHWNVPCELQPIVGAPHRQSDWEKFDREYRAKLLAWLGEHL